MTLDPSCSRSWCARTTGASSTTSRTEQSLACRVVRVPLPVRDGIPVMLIDEAEKPADEAEERPVIDLDDPAALRAADPERDARRVLELAAAVPRGVPARARRPAGCRSADGVTAVAVLRDGRLGGRGRRRRRARRGRVCDCRSTVVRTPELPAFCGPHTLVVASSYSGDTAETLDAVRGGRRARLPHRRRHLGGRARRAGRRSSSSGASRVPAGAPCPAPRSASSLLAHARRARVDRRGAVARGRPRRGRRRRSDAVTATLTAPRRRLAANPREGARPLGSASGRRSCGAPRGSRAVAAVRWKTQFNENAKVPAFAAVAARARPQRGRGLGGGRGRCVRPSSRSGTRASIRTSPRGSRLSIEIARASGAIDRGDLGDRDGRRSPRLLALVLHGDLVATYHALVAGRGPDADRRDRRG